MTDSGFLSAGVLLFVLGIVGGAGLWWTQNHRATLPFQLKLFGVAFVLRFAAAVVIYELGVVQLLGDEDAASWSSGLELARYWERFQVGIGDAVDIAREAFAGHHLGYRYALGLLFYIWVIGEPGRLVAAVLNCFAGAVTVVFAYRAARTVLSEESARLVAWGTCLFPSLIAWSAQTLKEPIVIVLQAVALYCCLRLHREGFALRYVAVATAAMILMVPFRFYAVYITGAAMALALVSSAFSGSGRDPLRPLLGVATAIAGIAVIFAIAQSQDFHFENFTLEYINRVRDGAAQGGSGVETPYDLSTPSGFAMAMIIGIVHLLFAPFPWQWTTGSPRLLLTIPEVLVWWWLLFRGVIPGVRYAIRSRNAELKTVLVFVVGFVLLYALLFGNVGQAYRQRAQLLPWLLIFALIGFEVRRGARTLETRPAATVAAARV